MTHPHRETTRRPTHPGLLVRHELENLGISVTEAAERLRVARPTLSQLVNARKRISPEMALRLGRFFGNGTELWLTMQARHDQWEVEHDGRALRAADEIEPLHDSRQRLV